MHAGRAAPGRPGEWRAHRELPSRRHAAPALSLGGPASCDALTYDIEVDDSCTTPGFASCTFASPESSATGLASPSHRPASDLPVSVVAPVGRRYYWRVRSCDGATCGAWSPVRYLDVGRVPSDLNGDGYADVVVAAPLQDAGATDEGNVFVYHGSASSVPASPSATLDNPANQALGLFGWSVASAGDVNGDGYADLVVGAYGQDAGATDEGNVFVYHGSASGVPASPSAALDNPANQAEGGFGLSVASAGDVKATATPTSSWARPGRKRARPTRATRSSTMGAPRACPRARAPPSTTPPTR